MGLIPRDGVRSGGAEESGRGLSERDDLVRWVAGQGGGEVREAADGHVGDSPGRLAVARDALGQSPGDGP